jgi:hypothetical protein
LVWEYRGETQTHLRD